MNPHPSHQFQPGGPGGPGRPRGSVGGRAQAIALIDQIISENADDLRAALLQAFKKNPVAFWQKYGFPLVPQALIMKTETHATQHNPWMSLEEAIETRGLAYLGQQALRMLPEAERKKALDEAELEACRAATAIQAEGRARSRWGRGGE